MQVLLSDDLGAETVEVDDTVLTPELARALLLARARREGVVAYVCGLALPVRPGYVTGFACVLTADGEGSEMRCELPHDEIWWWCELPHDNIWGSGE